MRVGEGTCLVGEPRPLMTNANTLTRPNEEACSSCGSPTPNSKLPFKPVCLPTGSAPAEQLEPPVSQFLQPDTVQLTGSFLRGDFWLKAGLKSHFMSAMEDAQHARAMT